MALSAQEFLLPGFGGDPGQGLQNLSNQVYMRNMQRQRLEVQKEGRRQQAGSFLDRYLDPKDYLSGSPYDPVITTNLNQALKLGAQMAQEGADIPTMIMGLSPYTSRLNDYSMRAKAVNKNIDESIKALRESGYKGYDYQAITNLAKRKAFHKMDPKSGEDLGLNEIENVDPSTDYVHQAIQDHPDQVTNASDFDEYANKAQKVETLVDNRSFDRYGKENRSKVTMKGQNYLVPDYDEQGTIKDLVPKYETATDGPDAVTHNFQDADGEEVNAPVRLLDREVFNDLIQRKGVGDYIRGQLMKHIKEYNQQSGKPIDLNSPQAEHVARAIAYDELKNRKGGGIQYANVENKPSAAQVQLSVFGSKGEQAYDRAYNSQAGKSDAAGDGYATPARGAPKTNTVDALHEVSNNNPEYLQGETEEVNGKAMMNILPGLPKAQLKYGHAANQVYDKVYYDPSDHSYAVKKKGRSEVEVIPQKDMQNFLYKIGQANGVQTPYIDKSLRKYGYKNGAYVSPGEAPDLTSSVNESRSIKIDHALESTDETVRTKNLKGMKVKDGEIIGYGERGKTKQFFGKDPFYLTIQKPDGTKNDWDFKSEGELKSYLKQSTLKTSEAKPAAAPKANLTKEDEAALKEVGY